MTLDEWARASLISHVPADLPVWHWTRAANAHALRAALRGGRDFTDFTEGATGPGFYVSTSAIDNIDKGDEVIHGVVPAGTPVLMLDADLFGFGVSEIFEMVLQQHGWPFRPPPFRGHVDPREAQPPKASVPGLLSRLQLPACVYIFGFHLSLMLRDRAALRLDPTLDDAHSVAAYVAAHPQEAPMLTPRETVHRWLQARIPGWQPPAPAAGTRRRKAR